MRRNNVDTGEHMKQGLPEGTTGLSRANDEYTMNMILASEMPSSVSAGPQR